MPLEELLQSALEAEHPKWLVDSSCLDKQSIRLIKLPNPDRNEITTIEGHRLASEIIVTMLPEASLNIRAHGSEVSFNKL